MLYASREKDPREGAGVGSLFVLSGMVVSIQSLMDTRIESLVARRERHRRTDQDKSVLALFVLISRVSAAIPQCAADRPRINSHFRLRLELPGDFLPGHARWNAFWVVLI